MTTLSCGHSACSQNYIDTGETRCIKDAESADAAEGAASEAPSTTTNLHSPDHGDHP